MFDAERGRYLERYICIAVIEGAPDEFERSDWRPLTMLLEARLEGQTFEGWAHEQGVFDMPSIQAGRKAWVLDLIAEFGG